MCLFQEVCPAKGKRMHSRQEALIFKGEEERSNFIFGGEEEEEGVGVSSSPSLKCETLSYYY